MPLNPSGIHKRSGGSAVNHRFNYVPVDSRIHMKTCPVSLHLLKGSSSRLLRTSLVLRALRGHCQNKTLQQIDTTLGRSQPIALGPGRTFVSEKASDVCRHVTRGRRVR